MPEKPPTYAPDDAALHPAALRALASPHGRDLRTAALDADPSSPAAVEKLRRHHPRDLVHAALILAKVHRKATLGNHPKFPAMPWFWGVPEALEQATSAAVARHKAGRFAALNPKPLFIADLCAGIGGDTLALSNTDPVIAVELSEVRAICTQLNARELPLEHPVTILQADLTRPLFHSPTAPHALAFHLDPARRTAGKRSHAYTDLIPGPPTIESILRQIPDGALKLSPGVDFASLPPGHLEIISELGTCVQAILWTGALASSLGGPTLRTATLINSRGQASSFTAPWQSDELPRLVEPQHFIYEVASAIHRAGLAAALAKQLDAPPINADIGYITTSQLVDHPALTRFTHLLTIPWSEKHVVAALRTLPPGPHGPVEVKPRGGRPIDTDRLQAVFAKATPRACAVLIYRTGDQTQASIVTRDSPQHEMS